MATKYGSVDEYLADAAPTSRVILQEIRELVSRLVPDAKETISYQMPAFRLQKVFFFYAAFKNHIGIYPPVHGDAALQRDLEPYRGPKGNLQFPLSQPIPFALIGRVAQALAKQ